MDKKELFKKFGKGALALLGLAVSEELFRIVKEDNRDEEVN